ncbi:iron-containing alcohol dehydrogenase [Halodesulfovibrio sp. MK-HDV]|jgi:alcohol dehydrogenase|uniref:iron-containing alcohol dehydrogenase n=1 Tax=unclassified Halodesulfovibrio TaxID=2644657 RepID=UPI00136A308F|nr:iron-containing alcohol dehydrogenase [Halodesulfovibrio sp. MK-HDV]KAF1075027.1 Long-chain-alcohol dehydrogenase 2 [Halodesulfovibrio sp. MK-HDV]
MIDFMFHMPTKLIFGSGKLKELSDPANVPGKKAFIVISSGGSMIRHSYLTFVQNMLNHNNVESVVYNKIQENPILDHVTEGAALARQHECDFVIGLGGGSSIDSAKSIALMANNEGNYWDYMQAGTGGKKTPANPALPIVAIPTTAGTGTEADPWTVITNSATNEKIGWGNDSTYPTLSIIDPWFTLTVPPKVTAFTGMDAFFHSVETYLSAQRQPTSDLLSQQAVQLLNTFLPEIVEEGQNIEARTMVSWASTAAGVCQSLSSCMSLHSMEHALSAYYPAVPHGAGLLMLSRAYFKHLTPHMPERMIDLAYFMDVDVDALPEEKRPYAFVDALDALIKKIGMGNLSLADYGVKKEDCAKMAKNAMETMGVLFTCTPVETSEAEVIAIFEDSF